MTKVRAIEAEIIKSDNEIEDPGVHNEIKVVGL